jgi:hypothetical protein
LLSPARKGWTLRRSTRREDQRHLPYRALIDLFGDVPLGDYDTPVADTARSLAAHCAAITAERPLALLVENAQWTDRASLKVLAHLARCNLPLLLVLAATPRTGENTPDLRAIFA